MMILSELIANIDVIKVIGRIEGVYVKAPIQLDVGNTRGDALMWGATKNYDQYIKLKSGILICSRIEVEDIKENVTYLIVENSRRTFLRVLKIMFPKEHIGSIAQSAKISKDVEISASCIIGEHVVIERGCTIGDYVEVDHNTVIKQNTKIGSHVKIGSNTVIGSVGFGYERSESGQYEQMLHIGNVIICEQVEIGNCTTIDRAVLGSTYIGKNVKIDNLVHIAHGVFIDENSLIIANSMIAGSVKIGKNVWIAPSTSILNKTQISNSALIGMGAVVIRSVEENAVVVGNPGKTIRYSS